MTSFQQFHLGEEGLWSLVFICRLQMYSSGLQCLISTIFHISKHTMGTWEEYFSPWALKQAIIAYKRYNYFKKPTINKYREHMQGFNVNI